MPNSSSKPNVSKVIGIQFSMLSPDEIRKMSVAEITSRDTYINNKPVIGGLFDPRMGILEPGIICPTDGLNYIETPGYFGHIELARPVYYFQYLGTIMKIIRCICFKCSKLLISKSKYENICRQCTSQETRWNKVYQIASKIKRCGEDSENGCGCLQPKKFRKDGISTIYAEWNNVDGLANEDKDKLEVKITIEMMLKILSRISDDDISFMGFSPTFSRPEWMICQVLAVPPPAVRPSIKQDGQQRSEDDISHIIVNIIKANNMLKSKIEQKAPSKVIDDWHMVLQYYVATQIDNNIPGVASVAQRSGRPLKSIKDRLNGKQGRVRGNLMGKRVDYSARSVITPDPSLSIKELGVPLKIAKNITKPVKVNDQNRQFLTTLVRNGPDNHPGAKILEKSSGASISLRYTDREAIYLENGDIVHRHMMDGDAVLFNRQPTLHRMSMMCHIARIMPQADTFRMNVADTKPYNADFDGDEMNLHMPQSDDAEMELRNLAAVPHQLISPANNQTIVGIFQDSLLGAYRFTRENINFTPRDAMNLLMHHKNINIELLSGLDEISSFDILSQIMPPLTLNYKTKHYKDEEDVKTANTIIDIKNGRISRGQLEKSVLGSGTKGILHRVCNDFGNMTAADFVDDLQNIVTEYMKTSGYSVGISDLIADKRTNELIIEKITDKKNDVKTIIDQTHLGVFANKTGKSNNEEFETQINNILNEAAAAAGKIGRTNLSSNNRFTTMVNAGSKGSDLNISQMISCLGQQNVDGKRIPYGFDSRTLPHYNKYDDSPSSRGFVESSFIGGLTPQELFFHAMGGRVGLIDTAVKTSQTGYIQRRLIKGMEDLMAHYDMTVRNNKGKIVQFNYGDDAFDTVKVENQKMPLVKMTIEEIYSHFQVVTDSKNDVGFKNAFISSVLNRIKKQKTDLETRTNELVSFMITSRERIMNNIFKNQTGDTIHLPIAFSYIINNIQNQNNIQSNSLSDVTPMETFKIIDKGFNTLMDLHYSKPNELFKIAYYFHLSPKELLIKKRFNKKAVIILVETITMLFKKSLVSPGEMVGMIAAQSIGEPTTQMTLNTFHFAGVASKSNVTRGVPRVEEILSISENLKQPSTTIYVKNSKNREHVQRVMTMIERTKLKDIVEGVDICFDPDDLDTLIFEDKTLINQYKDFEQMMDECNEDNDEQDSKSKWIMRFTINRETMLEKNLTMSDINFAIKNSYGDEIHCIYSDYNSDKLIFRIRLSKVLQKKSSSAPNTLDQSDEIYLLQNFQDQILENIVLRGVKNIDKVILRKDPNVMIYEDGKYKQNEIWLLDTVGTNLIDILALDYIDKSKTYSNSITEIYKTLGIEAARQSIYKEFSEVIESDGTYINEHHLTLLCDRMTYSKKMISIFRHGINNDDIGPIAKASFEETPEMFLRAARHGELDEMRGVSSNVMCGQEGYYGTSSFSLFLDLDEFSKLTAQKMKQPNEQKEIDEMFKDADETDKCSKANILIETGVANIKPVDLGNDDDDYNINF